MTGAATGLGVLVLILSGDPVLAQRSGGSAPAAGSGLSATGSVSRGGGAPSTAKPVDDTTDPAIPLPDGRTTRDLTSPKNGGVAGTGLGGSTGGTGNGANPGDAPRGTDGTGGFGSGSSVQGPPGQGLQGQGSGGTTPQGLTSGGQIPGTPLSK